MPPTGPSLGAPRVTDRNKRRFLLRSPSVSISSSFSLLIVNSPLDLFGFSAVPKSTEPLYP